MVAMPAPTETAAPRSSATPLPRIGYKGIEFAFDEAALGPLGPAAHHPPVASGHAPVQPEHLEIRLKAGDQSISPILYVFPVGQYESLSEEAAAEIAELRSLLAERPQEIHGDMPFLPMYNAVESYHSDPKYIDFRNGSGMSFLTRVDHDHSLATSESIFYTFQGLTVDDQFYIATLVPITDVNANEFENAQGEAQEGETTEHRAKAAASNGNWISVDLGDGHSLIDDMMHSLQVSPDESFPAIKLPHMITANGLLSAYDEEISGSASFEQGPALIESPTGVVEYLQGVPDLLAFHFQPRETDATAAELLIQPIRDEQGAFFAAIPKWQQELTAALEQNDISESDLLLDGRQLSTIQAVSFQNGSGFRGITSGAAAAGGKLQQNDSSTYFYRGISDDGRYLIRFEHPLPGSIARLEALDYLDAVVASLLVSADASMGSSMPVNEEDCENNAEFIEDVSIPDYTVVERGDTFIKIWRLRNSGTCTWTPAYTVAYAQGNPTEWQALAIAEVVMPGEETEVGVTVQSPEYPGIYHAWWQMVDEQEQEFGDLLSLLFEAPQPATDISGYGVIEGKINYPATGNPAVEIYFQTTDGSERHVMQTEQGWTSYSKPVPVGSYFVFARVLGDKSDSGGGYTEAVVCGLQANCDDHSLIEIVVEEGRANRDVNLFDWYAPAGSFPLPDPVVVPPPEAADS